MWCICCEGMGVAMGVGLSVGVGVGMGVGVYVCGYVYVCVWVCIFLSKSDLTYYKCDFFYFPYINYFKSREHLDLLHYCLH